MRRRGPVPKDYVPETVQEFFEPPVGQWRFGAFPPDRFLIGMAFEVGGAYEDWGWIMYDHFPKGAKLKTFVTARTLPDLLAKAEAKMRESR